MTWSREFADPIELTGKTIRSLRDAAEHIQSLPKADQSKPHWQAAVEHLIKAAESSEAWMLFAWMFMLKALNHGRSTQPKTLRKKGAKAYRIIS